MTENSSLSVRLAKRGWLPAASLLLCLGLGLSTLYYRQAKSWERDGWRQAVSVLAAQRVEMLNLRLSRVEEGVLAVAALFDASEQVSRREFDIYSRSIRERLPEVGQLQWQPKVSGAERARFEAMARRDGLAGFAFTEPDSHGRAVPAAKRDAHFPVYYAASGSAGDSSLGLDLAWDPARMAHKWQAVEQGRMVFSAPYPIMTDQGGRLTLGNMGLVVSQPVYTKPHPATPALRRQSLRGFVAAVVDVDQALQPLAQDLSTQGVDVLVYDDTLATHSLFYSRLSGASDLAVGAGLEQYQPGDLDVEKRLELGGRTWRLVFHPTAGFLDATRSWHPELALLAGGLITFILVGQVYANQRRRKDVERVIARLRESEERFNLFMDNSPGLAFVKDAEGRLVYINQTFAKGFGFTAPEHWQGKTDHDLWPEEAADAFRRNDLAVMAGGKARVMEERAQRNGRQETWLSVKFPFRDRHGQRYLGGIAMNVSDRKTAEEQLRLAARVFENAAEAIIISDANNTIITVNPAFEQITGYSADEVVGKNPKMLSSGRQPPAFYQRMWQLLREVGCWQGEIWNRRKNGEPYAEWLSISAVRDDGGHISHFIGIFSDITERKLAEDRIQFLAHYDDLTQLPNRSLTCDRLRQAVLAASRSGGSVSVLFLDLDRFKIVNDSLGHHVGDGLLQEVAKRVVACLREVDTVGRLGGDEFLVVLPDTDADGAAHVAQRILKALSTEVVVQEHSLSVSSSVGVAVYPADGGDIASLMKNADAAMYHAKQSGSGHYQFFDAQMDAAAHEHLRLESGLRSALAKGELTLYYQPKVDLAERRVVGCEALMRWHHPELGVVSPDRFIPVAEECGLIVTLGEWAMREACRRIREFQQVSGEPLTVAVNVSALQFNQRNFVDTVRRVLEETGLEPGYLELELTESALMKDTDNVLHTLEALSAMGVKLSIDDFGTGYSSLGYLKRFPIDRLKIDRGFVRDLETDADDAAIVNAVIRLAHSLRLTVVGEGVETPGQLRFLQERGCEEAQGFYFDRPLAAGDFQRMLQNQPAVFAEAADPAS